MGVCLDKKYGTIQFYKDGKPLGVAFQSDNLKASQSSSETKMFPFVQFNEGGVAKLF